MPSVSEVHEQNENNAVTLFLVPSVQPMLRISQEEQGFQMRIIHQSRPPMSVGFFTSLSITSPPSSSKVIFFSMLTNSRIDEESSTS